MEFLLVIHLLICAAMIGVVLLQKSEGGALGIGGGGGGGFLTGRGTANLLTRITAGLAAGFFATSIVMSVIAGTGKAPTTPFSTPAKTQPSGTPQPSGGAAKPGAAAKPGNLLDKLKSGKAREHLPSVPQGN